MKKLWFLLLPLGGALCGLCLVFPAVGLLQWVAPVPALLYFFGRVQGGLRPRRAYGLGFCYFYAFYLVCFHWFLALYPMEFAGVSEGTALLLVLFCWLGLSLLQALCSALVFPLFVLLARSCAVRRLPLLAPFLFAALYTVFEWMQTLTWAGVPWARLPLGQASCGLLWNSAALFGSYFLTFALMAFAALVSFAVLHLDRWRVAAIACTVVFVVNLGAGAIGYFTANLGMGDSFTAAAVQGNVGSSQKWTSASTQQSYEVYEQYTAEAVEQGAKLLVFPETFIPHVITESSTLGRYIRYLASQYDVTILCGAFAYDDEGNMQNAVFTAFPDGSFSETVYAKRHLVPFGEYVPMRAFVEFVFPPLADIGMLSDDLAPGTDSAVVESDCGRLGALICFDSIYEALVLDSVRDGAELLILPTNDSWFEDSAAARMHLAQARLRAIETRRCVVRAADTGISAVISPDGTTADETPALTSGLSLSTVSLSQARTLYSYIGNLFVYLLLAGLALLALQHSVSLVKKRRFKSTEEA